MKFSNNPGFWARIPKSVRKLLVHDLLSVRETARLVRLYNRGTREALSRLLAHNQRMIFSVAARYMDRISTLDIQDLMQEGMLGFMKAVVTYKPSRGKFTDHAFSSVRRSIIDAISEKERAVRFPHDICQHLRIFRETAHILSERFGRAPTEGEIIAEAKLPKSNRDPVKTIRLLDIHIVSFDAEGECGSGDSRPLSECLRDGRLLPSEVSVAKEELECHSGRIRNLKSEVQKIENRCARELFLMNYGLNGHHRTGKALREHFGGISKQRVNQITGEVWKHVAGHQSIRDGKTYHGLVSKMEEIESLVH